MRISLIGHFILALLVGVPCAQAQTQPQITLTPQGNADALFAGGPGNYPRDATTRLTLNVTGLSPNQGIDYLTIKFFPAQGHANTLEGVTLNYPNWGGIGAIANAAKNWTGQTPPRSYVNFPLPVNGSVFEARFRRPGWGSTPSPAAPIPQTPGAIIGTYTIDAQVTIMGQTYNANQLTGTVRFAPASPPPPPPQQQMSGYKGYGSVVTLQRRFNPKSGKVEIIKNGVISRRGFFNFQSKNSNPRINLRNYR